MTVWIRVYLLRGKFRIYAISDDEAAEVILMLQRAVSDDRGVVVGFGVFMDSETAFSNGRRQDVGWETASKHQISDMYL